MPTPELPSPHRLEAVHAHTATLITSLQLLADAQQAHQSREVINKLAARAIESIDQINHTLAPARKQLENLLGHNR